MNFQWAIQNELATGSLPTTENDVKMLRGSGIKAVLSLESPSPHIRRLLDQYGIERHYAPIQDFSQPGHDQMDELREILNAWRQQGKPVLVHCYVGIGRCRTVACAFIASQIADVEDAFRWVGLPETEKQREFVREYAAAKRG